MNKNVIAELPADMVSWLEQNISDDTWSSLARDLAVRTAATLMTGRGEAGINKTVFRLLCEHPSRAVRALSRSATSSGTRRWYARPIAKRVAEFFEVPFTPLYHQLLWSDTRECVVEESLSSDKA